MKTLTLPVNKAAFDMLAHPNAETREVHVYPYKKKAIMNEVVAEELKSKGFNEESVNDYLQMIDE